MNLNSIVLTNVYKLKIVKLNVVVMFWEMKVILQLNHFICVISVTSSEVASLKLLDLAL